ncbi:adenylate cyclase associated N terminal-domain-containing protein [Lipomyces orientalis]|uniref:Adenylate cyclase associated N terminal-domain-containing protein n=1 Tax=Lipomyces orientalis TaxID=1233043 RepID=A0ACC3TKD9_9ASCO
MADVNIPGYNMVTLMKRLEAATSRLEDLTVFQTQAMQSRGLSTPTTLSETTIPGSVTPTPASTSTSTIATPAPAAPASTPAPAPASEPIPAPIVEELPVSLKEFDEFVADYVTPLVELSKGIDPLVEEQAKHLAAAFDAEREFLRIVSKSKKPAPSSSVFVDLFKPITVHIELIQDLREKNRTSKFFNHLSTICEGAPALGWVGVEPTPVPFVGEMKDSAQFYSNRVLKDYKDIDRKHVEWAQSFLKVLTGLQVYVKKHHTTGPTWNAKGEEVQKVLAESSGATPAPVEAAAGAPPPPPPPPPPPASVFQVTSEALAPNGGLGAVFAEINKGEAITSGLKKVDKSQMTHKNPSLRAQEPIASDKPGSPAPPSKPQNLKQKKPPRIELEGTKWIVENFENDPKVIVVAEINHGVFIHRCKNSTVQIKGKFNTVTLNECNSTGLLVESLVSSVDVIKSNNFALQVTGKLPTISVDQCDNGQIYLSTESMEVEIYTSKSSGLNVNVPDEAEEGDFKERPVPEQLLHRISNGKLVSTIVEHIG